MYNQALHDSFRKQLTKVHAITVFTVSLFEIIGYVLFVLYGKEDFSLRNHYLWYSVVIPILINVTTHLIARAIINSRIVGRRQKNKTIITAALITSFVVAVIHKEYIITSCAFVFPIILSAMFNDERLLNASFFSSIFIFFAVGMAFWLDKAITLTTCINLSILFGFLLISYLCGIISINFSKRNYVTIENQLAENNKLLHEALYDQMTGLYNRNAFVSHLEELIQNFDSDEPLCLAVIDVDNFKNINDTYGHSYGDIVLMDLADFLKSQCDSEAIAYRYGGEEFAVLFSGKTAKEVRITVERMLAKFRKHKFEFCDRYVTFSAGIADYNEDMTFADFFETADKVLYMAKKGGKNRVMVKK